MEKPITVIFEPDERRIKTTSGTSIFEATCETGVGTRSECGGKGICGKCRVVVQDKDTLGN
jgi:uncharacterized 2Fe-2S/4Fe-4S cluster protein (DUF4445 family)